MFVLQRKRHYWKLDTRAITMYQTEHTDRYYKVTQPGFHFNSWDSMLGVLFSVSCTATSLSVSLNMEVTGSSCFQTGKSVVSPVHILHDLLQGLSLSMAKLCKCVVRGLLTSCGVVFCRS